MGILAIIFILAMVLFGFRFFVQTTMMRMRNSLGLTFQARFFRAGGLVGKVDGVPVKAWEYVHKDDVSMGRIRVWTDVLVEIEGKLPDGLRISYEGVVANLGKAVGMQDIVVGHPALDKLVVIKGRDPAEVKAFFSRPGVAQATLDIFENYSDLILTNNKLKIRQHTDFGPNTEYLIVSMVRFVRALQGDPDLKSQAPKGRLKSLVPEGLDDASFEDNAQFIKQEIARRKSAGTFNPTTFDHPAPQLIEEPPPTYHVPDRSAAGEDFAQPLSEKSPEQDGAW